MTLQVVTLRAASQEAIRFYTAMFAMKSTVTSIVSPRVEYRDSSAVEVEM
jgi:hypothetical protein